MVLITISTKLIKKLTPKEPNREDDTALKVYKPIKYHLKTQQEETDNQKHLTKKHDEHLAITLFIVGAGLNAFHFW